MVWAVLVAVGVAVISMTLFGVRLTRKPSHMDRIVDDLATSDPDDPWAAWKPRPLDELDRPRARLWPVGAALTGLVMIGAGFAGARQTLWASPTSAGPVGGATPKPYVVQVEIPETPTPKPTPRPTATPVPATPRPTVRPAMAATAAPATSSAPTPTAAVTGSAPVVSGSASCSGGTLSLSYSATGTELSWLAVYADGAAVKGGPISGNSHSSSYQKPASSGDHDLEVVVEDKAGRTSRKAFGATCP
jgi:hypothetical protein